MLTCIKGATAIGKYLSGTYGNNSFAILVDEGGQYGLSSSIIDEINVCHRRTRIAEASRFREPSRS